MSQLFGAALLIQSTEMVWVLQLDCVAALHENTVDFLFETTKTKRAEGPADVHDWSISRVNLLTANHTQPKTHIYSLGKTVYLCAFGELSLSDRQIGNYMLVGLVAILP